MHLCRRRSLLLRDHRRHRTGARKWWNQAAAGGPRGAGQALTSRCATASPTTTIRAEARSGARAIVDIAGKIAAPAIMPVQIGHSPWFSEGPGTEGRSDAGSCFVPPPLWQMTPSEATRSLCRNLALSMIELWRTINPACRSTPNIATKLINRRRRIGNRPPTQVSMAKLGLQLPSARLDPVWLICRVTATAQRPGARGTPKELFATDGSTTIVDLSN